MHCMLNHGMKGDCLFATNELLSFRSAQARAHASLGYVYELLQDTDKAIDHYEQVWSMLAT